MTEIIVEVMPKAEILDPQGQAIARALQRLGYEGVADVRQGKRFELHFSDSIPGDQIEKIAADILANTVIEDYKVIIS